MEQKKAGDVLWSSPIEGDRIVGFQTVFHHLDVDGSKIFWTEARPLEKGRHALLRKEASGSIEELFPSMNLQTKIHEYGGGAFSAEKGCLVFFDAYTTSLYVQKSEGALVCLCSDPLKRWADFSFSPDLEWVVGVCEDHACSFEVVNSIVAVQIATKQLKVIHKGADFYASPRWSPDGKAIAFLTWNFPSMPWDECALKGVSWSGLKELFSMGSSQESISQFIWGRSGEIFYASDARGFSNLYRWSAGVVTPLCPREADFAPPLWILGKKHFERISWQEKEGLVVSFCERGIDRLGVLEIESLQLQVLDLPFTVIRSLDAGDEGIYFIGGSPTLPLSLVFFDLKTKNWQILASSCADLKIDPACLSMPVEVSASSSLDGQTVFGFFYPPQNPNYFPNSLPPLIIKCHSGPTAHVPSVLNLEVQFWTSRGFAWLDVNYRGSSGFGREYRKRLDGNWGIVDVRDCLDLSDSLAKKGWVDVNLLFAKGGSAGGFTALCMAAHSSSLKGCISSYGVTDLLLLTKETHKFERYYLDSLVGDLQTFKERYIERSPLHLADQISCPVLFLHGEADRVVPLSQAEHLHERLHSSELKVFPGEGHGFRRAETIQACLEAEMNFYTKILKKEGKVRL